jgi:crossover junction endodeoxyribonuclease RuvC
VRVFGIDPGSERTGYGCVETDGSRHRIIACGAISSTALASFPDKLHRIHSQLTIILADCRPACVAIENVFYSVNARSALKLGHARGVAMLAAVEAGVPVFEYTPAEIKRAVVGYGRADKAQVQQMIKLLLGLARAPSPHDAADALAVAICHATRAQQGHELAAIQTSTLMVLGALALVPGPSMVFGPSSVRDLEVVVPGPRTKNQGRRTT